MADKAEKTDKSDDVVAVDPQTGIFPKFRQLWNGGEHRNAVDFAKAENVSEAEWTALLAEFPGIVDVINQ
ncbi:hypothetical protein [Mesorhizobium sp. RIZ17]|uniref:hypothetical protein n=1 Tax=Mesorhizobium sp. RIZ17 TaxID=3132743 RepID=UPI003DA9BEF3